MKQILLLFFTLTLVFKTWAQIEVTGTITSEDGETLPGASVLETGTTNGTITNVEGEFTLSVSEGASLTVSFVGYESMEIPVNGRTRIDIKLGMDLESLEEVVVVGYGTQSRKTLTTSIAKLDGKNLEGLPVSSISTGIQGKMSGVRVYQDQGGQPGADATILIRGGSSINRSNQPLVLVDGIQRPMSDINPNDVESIEVLKDASSTAVYGSRASNGVIIITTKKGRAGKANITFDANYGVASAWKLYDLVNARQFLELTRPALQRSPNANQLSQSGRGIGIGNSGDSPWSPRYLQSGESVPEGYLSMPDPIDPNETIIFQDNDFQDLGFRNAIEQNYYLSANGGSENILYAAGIGYTNYEGIAIGTEWNRMSGRANVDFVLSKNLSLQTSLDHTASYTNRTNDQRAAFARNIFLAPTAKVYQDDGTYAAGLNSSWTNPLWYNDVHSNDRHIYRTQLGSSLIWDIIEGLEGRVNMDYLLSNSTLESFQKANVYTSARQADFNYDQARQLQFEGILTFNKDFGDHHLNIVAGASRISFNNLDARATALGGSTDKIQTLNAAPEKTDAYTYRTDEILAGVFSRVTYDYNQKYLIGLSMRRDESSRFAESNRVGYFPGVSLGWVLSEEGFFNAGETINLLKIRSSLGQTGNNSVGLYDAWGQYAVGYNYNFEAGTFPTKMPNFSLGWETTTQFDIGVDAGLFSNRITFLIDYYNKVTQDLIFNTPLPNTSGFDDILRNVGKVRFYGLDLEIKTNPIASNSFRWDLGFNLTYNKNEVLELPDNGAPQNRIGGVYNPETGEGFGGIAEGEPLYQITGFENDFIIDNQTQADDAHYDSYAAGYDWNTQTYQTGRKFPGDMEWVDKDGNDTIDVYDQFVLGYQIPYLVGGISNTLSYRDFQLNIFMDYAIGHTIMDATIRRADANAIGGAARMTTKVLDSWENEGDAASGKAKMPRFDWHDASQQGNVHRDSRAAAYKSDFLCLREVRLGYNIPARIVEKIGISSSSLYVAGQNLHYFTKYPGYVPEFQGGSNYADGNYPIPRKVLIGLKIGF